ncbi:MAG: penicillin-binding protein 2 [Rickettsiales bacterium]|nr:penicillin-binding protein 2 [Rickettsiales bacterium]
MTRHSTSSIPVHRMQRDSASKRSLDQCRTRLVFIAGLLLMCYALLAVRIIDVSLLQPNNNRNQMMANNGLTPVKKVNTVTRGSIYDRNGELLAVSLPSQTLYAKPRIIDRFGAKEAAEKLAHIFPDLDRKKILKKLNPKRSFVYLKRHITPSQMEAVNALGIPGLEFEEAMRRVYPHGNSFSHTVGFTNVDGEGLSAIEKKFDKSLSEKGEDLTLSMDARLQHILRDELRSGMEEFKAIGGVGVVMDITNGEIMALSSLPDFDPNEPKKATADARFNRAATGVYEMGSTFKTFTTAMALHHKTAKIFDRYDVTKPIKIAKYTIRDSHPENRWLTVPEIFMLSSNIGTVKMVMDVGKKRQQDFLKQLGLFERVPIELPEVAMPLIPKTWRDINMMTISYGHGISVTPLHLIQSIGTLLGDGKKLSPTLIKDAHNEETKTRPTVIAQETTDQLRKLMRLVVEHGTARKANAVGYRVGGKTGTAEKVKNGNYRDKDKLASFVGVFPTEAPRYVILAMLDEPRGNKSTYGYATGGWVAAPIVKRIIEKMAPLYGIRPIFELPAEGTAKGAKVQAISF